MLRLLTLFALAICSLSIVLAGCGSGGSTSGTGSDRPAAPVGGMSAEFLDPSNPKINKEIVEFGREAPEAERLVANAVVVKNLKAREEADFATQCATLNRQTINAFSVAKGGCAAGLKSFAEPLSKSKAARRDTLSGAIAVLRVKGKLGYALYHGNDGKDRGLLLEKEGNSWKVASLLTFEL